MKFKFNILCILLTDRSLQTVHFKKTISFTPKLQILLLILLFINSCIVQYIPKTNEEEALLVVEGQITDQPGINTIKLLKSQPLWSRNISKPLKGCKVWISDEIGQINSLKETTDGTYVTDPTTFQGVIGKYYTLHIKTTNDTLNHSYESLPMEMKAVPPIDSMYYEKNVSQVWPRTVEGCQIYLDTHDPSNNCKFYKWEYSETWEFHLPFDVQNKVCWITNNSNEIVIKNASFISENSILRHQVISIPNPIDRLSVKYSLLVKQYSLNEEEYLYWERLKNTIDQVGGLYDMVPTVIPNNVFCLNHPDEKILGYFSVSAVKSKRIFIKDTFAGFDAQYMNCASDTIMGINPIPGLNTSVWVLVDNSNQVPPVRVVTYERRCADCTTRGTNIKPSFWDDVK
jgi:hypothetical protein